MYAYSYRNGLRVEVKNREVRKCVGNITAHVEVLKKTVVKPDIRLVISANAC